MKSATTPFWFITTKKQLMEPGKQAACLRKLKKGRKRKESGSIADLLGSVTLLFVPLGEEEEIQSCCHSSADGSQLLRWVGICRVRTSGSPAAPLPDVLGPLRWMPSRSLTKARHTFLFETSRSAHSAYSALSSFIMSESPQIFFPFLISKEHRG